MSNDNSMRLTFGGYQCGDLGRVIRLHGEYYQRHWGFDLSFEIQEARELAEFLERFDGAQDVFLAARLAEEFAGAIAIDHGAPEPGWVRLRWFIVEEKAQGKGLGKELLGRALDLSKKVGHQSVYLWTFAGLDSARRLYEGAGFSLAEEREVQQWGVTVREQRFELKLFP